MDVFTTLAVFVSLLSVAFSHPLTLLKEDKVAVSNVICADGVSQCPTGDTCCKNQNGYGCCPKLNAVCCADMIHCCPHGYTCGKTVCERADSNHPMLELSRGPTVQNIVCPDGKEECPNSNTCCMTSSSSYGCCPKPDAVCCSDMKHCCPKGYKCETDQGKCRPAYHPMLELSARPKETATETVENVICPGGVYECPTGDTCCKNQNGYGCCPKPSAVCCADMVHCCPNGYTCETSHCKLMDSHHPMLELSASPKETATVKETVENVICPDNSECPTGTTCCVNGQGGFGCCPNPNAVCCGNNICCPNGYICCAGSNYCCPLGTTCEPGNLCKRVDHPMLELSRRPKETATAAKSAQETVKETVENVICPDNSECPTGTTCCVNGQGGYGCCPNQNAECCGNNICCPNGYICCADSNYCCPLGTTCEPGNLCEQVDHPMLELSRRPKETATAAKSAQETVKETVENVICPGGEYECPTGDTCCANGQGGYGCCPKPSAVCCADMVHCCPNGYICGASDCKPADSYHPMLELSASPKETVETVKETATVKETVENVICPGGEYECPTGNTCCANGKGYGCCPEPSAVCCSDEKHCCPNGYTCGASNCEQEDSYHPMLELSERPVACPDDLHECPSGNTCCLQSNGYGCCPGIKAVCCSDQLHCCPYGYKCDSSKHACTRSAQSLPWYAMMTKVGGPEDIL